jgi:hypothetical protein
MLRRRTAGFWSSDRSLSAMLILLVGNIFLLPLAQFATWGRLAARSILSLIIISGVMATIRDRRIILIATAVALGSLGVGWEDIERPNVYLHLLNDLDSVLFISFFIVLITRQTLRAGPITGRRVQGSVAVYLLLGFLWGVLYETVESLRPGSFSIGTGNGVVDIQQLGYFSLTTLTTLGIGDILPISPLARSLTVLEALVGQLFPVILIARLVAMEIEYQRERRPH